MFMSFVPIPGLCFLLEIKDNSQPSQEVFCFLLSLMKTLSPSWFSSVTMNPSLEGASRGKPLSFTLLLEPWILETRILTTYA